MTIDSFSGKYRFLSNFYPCDVAGRDGRMYLTSEHAFQAAKLADPADVKRIRTIISPGQAKRFARGCVLRDDWQEIKVSVMDAILWDKFSRNAFLARKLLATQGHDLIEGNTWGDTFWGVCDGVGENRLGRLLVRVRDELSADA